MKRSIAYGQEFPDRKHLYKGGLGIDRKEILDNYNQTLEQGYRQRVAAQADKKLKEKVCPTLNWSSS
jgi:hypothetical protein